MKLLFSLLARTKLLNGKQALYTAMPNASFALGPETSRIKQAGGLTLNLFLQFCVLFQVNIILKDI